MCAAAINMYVQGVKEERLEEQSQHESIGRLPTAPLLQSFVSPTFKQSVSRAYKPHVSGACKSHSNRACKSYGITADLDVVNLWG